MARRVSHDPGTEARKRLAAVARRIKPVREDHPALESRMSAQERAEWSEARVFAGALVGLAERAWLYTEGKAGDPSAAMAAQAAATRMAFAFERALASRQTRLAMQSRSRKGKK